MKTFGAAIGISLALVLCDVRAQDLQAARACARLTDNAARLACYDKEFAVNAVAKFGDNGQLHRDADAKADLPKSLPGQVVAVKSLTNNLYRLTLDNGQVWQTTQADWAVVFEVNDRVIISRMPLGGYQISSAGNSRSVGAKRVQ